MGIFSFLKKEASSYFTEVEKERVLQAIRSAETRTSGEVRVFIERRCRFVNPIDRAAEVFFGLKMEQTDYRNAVLVYVAMKDKQLAVFADEGIYNATGASYWNEEVKKMLQAFKKENYAEGIATVVCDVGDALVHFFPYNKDTDKNELPDDIVFGS